MKKKIIILFCLITLAAPLFAFAAPCQINTNNTPPLSSKDLPACINQIYIWSLGVAALLAFLMIIIGGYYYMTSSGNAEQAAKGVEMIWGAIIGLALLFGAYLLLNTINPDLVNFQNFTTDFSNIDQTQTQTPGTTSSPGTGVRQ